MCFQQSLFGIGIACPTLLHPQGVGFYTEVKFLKERDIPNPFFSVVWILIEN